MGRIGFESAAMSRSTVAWSPDNGKCFQPNDPRICRDRVPILSVRPRIYHTFDVTEGFMDYTSGAPGRGSTWCVGPGGRLEAFELSFPEFVRETYGQSTLGKDLYAYRLVKSGWVGDPLATKHFIVVNVCHGNEVDGINGAFKAMEILVRHGDFAAFRAEWSILFIPFLNPDGWEVWDRSLQVVGPNGSNVNLNRQADWFWSDYVEEGDESKGSAPWSENEGAALVALHNGIVAAGGSWGVYLDMHATEGGGGARYYTRDRLMQHVTGPRGTVGEIPTSDLNVFIDYYIWRTSNAFAVKRVADEGGPDLHMRLYRSRYSPKLHSYFSSLGVFSTVAEEAKVSSAPAGTVSYKSACNFRLDHILASALCCTAANWSYEDAVLVEPGTTNIMSNSSFTQWQGDAEVGMDTQYTDYFTTAALCWGLTTITYSGTTLVSGAAAGSAVLLTAPKNADMLVQVEAKKAASDTISDFFVAARALFSGAVVTDGYKLQFDDATKIWSLKRVVASAETVIATYDASASTSRQINTTQKKVYLRARFTTPVELYCRIQSGTTWYTLFDTNDSDASRILGTNQCGFGGQSNATNLVFDNFVLQSSAIEERPGYFSSGRGTISRTTVHDGEKFFDDGGEALELTAHPDISLSQAAEFCALAPVLADGSDSGLITICSFDAVHYIPPAEYTAKEIYAAGTFAHPTPVGCAVFGGGSTGLVYVLGGGTANFTGAGTGYTYLSASTSAPIQNYVGALTGFSSLMHMGFCGNELAASDLSATTGWLFGGMNAAGVYQTKIWQYTLGATSISGKVAILPKALIGLAAVYDKDTASCFLFGGYDGAAPVTDIYQYDPALDSLTDHTLTVALPVALAYLAAAECPYNGKIYLFGGEKADGTMSGSVYEFDPAALTIEEIFPTQTGGVEETNEGGVGGPWAKKIGRWHAVAQAADNTDWGVIVLVGGRADSNVGALSDEFYVFDPRDTTIDVYRASEYGYVRYSSKIDLSLLSFVARDFTGETSVGAGWDDLKSNWTIGGGVATSSATGGPLTYLTQPTYVNQRAYCTAIKSGAGNMVNFHIDLRATYDGSGDIQNGYRLIYTEADKTWRIQRYVAGVATTLHTYDSTGSAARRIDNVTVKTVFFRALMRSPVEFYAQVQYGGTNYTIFASTGFYDYDAERCSDVGWISVGAKSGTANVIVDDFDFQDSGGNEEKFTCASSVKAEASNVSGYYRFSFQPASSLNSVFTTRYCSQYYLVPPKTRYYFAKGRCDFRNGLGLKFEDSVRMYHRVYWEGQKLYLDGVHLAQGTLIPTSYHKEGLTRDAEVLTFPGALDPNCFCLRFYFMPTFCANDVEDTPLEIARVSADADNYLMLEVIPYSGLDRWIREYAQNSIDGPQDPILRLSKIRTGTTVASMDMVCYFGNALFGDSDPVNEYCEDVMRITITNTPQQCGLSVWRFGQEGRKQDNTDIGNDFALSTASIIYKGVGYFTEPEILDEVRSPRGRVLPARRAGVLDRMREKQRHAFFAGDRDPTNGTVIGQPFYTMGGLTFGAYDNFTRSNSSGLGEKWYEDISATYYNWGITSNQARVTGKEAFALMAFSPAHADIKIVANVRTVGAGNSSKVGIIGRCSCEQNDTTFRPNFVNGKFGYEARLERVSTSAANLKLYRHYKADTVTLATAALSSYSAGETLELVLDMQGTTIACSITGRASISVTDDIHVRARCAGIYGSATGTDYSIIDDFKVYPNFDNEVGE